MRRSIAAFAVVPVVLTLGAEVAQAHGGLRLSDPRAGARLGDTPTAVRLSFSEKPEPSLSVIRVLGVGGAKHELGSPVAVAGDPHALNVRVRTLKRGVYTVSWRIVSAVDGHATAGTYAFGVGVLPTGAAAAASTSNPTSSRLEMLARWILIVGLVALLGAASAAVARFGVKAGDDLLGAGGWFLSAVGLVVLTEAQRRSAATSLIDLADTSVGRALIWRAVAIAAAGAALLVARWESPRIRPVAMSGVALAALAAMGIHVAAGHAAAGTWPPAATVAAQWAHFAAAGIWLGGLAALLLGVRGAPSAEKAAAVRRFSIVAAGGLIVVVATGVVRAVDELSSWRELVSTGYGRAVVAKIALILGIAGFGALNRWRSMPAAALDLGRLRRSSRGELVLVAGALAVAAVLGTFSPAAAGEVVAPPGIAVSGADVGSTVRVELTAASPEPGPNRFVVRVVDFDSKKPVHRARVSLRFAPLDDPGVAPTSLVLARGADGSYGGSGSNLAFDGRWLVTALVKRAAEPVEIPLELEAKGPAQFVSIERIPGQAPKYTVQIDEQNSMRFSPDPEQPGRSKLYVTCFDFIGDEQRIDRLVVTLAPGKAAAKQQPLRRLGRGRFVADVVLQAGSVTIAGVARTVDGNRLRASVDLEIPDG